MAKMKTALLEAAIAIRVVIDAGGTVEQILDLVDYIDDFSTLDRETR
jgi:hypothetical protein